MRILCTMDDKRSNRLLNRDIYEFELWNEN